MKFSWWLLLIGGLGFICTQTDAVNSASNSLQTASNENSMSNSLYPAAAKKKRNQKAKAAAAAAAKKKRKPMQQAKKKPNKKTNKKNKRQPISYNSIPNKSRG